MKITIEAEVKEIAALAKEPEGRQRVETQIDPGGSSVSTVENYKGKTVINTTADGIAISAHS